MQARSWRGWGLLSCIIDIWRVPSLTTQFSTRALAGACLQHRSAGHWRRRLRRLLCSLPLRRKRYCSVFVNVLLGALFFCNEDECVVLVSHQFYDWKFFNRCVPSAFPWQRPGESVGVCCLSLAFFLKIRRWTLRNCVERRRRKEE